jgi:hypothetical protein
VDRVEPVAKIVETVARQNPVAPEALSRTHLLYRQGMLSEFILDTKVELELLTQIAAVAVAQVQILHSTEHLTAAVVEMQAHQVDRAVAVAVELHLFFSLTRYSEQLPVVLAGAEELPTLQILVLPVEIMLLIFRMALHLLVATVALHHRVQRQAVARPMMVAVQVDLVVVITAVQRCLSMPQTRQNVPVTAVCVVETIFLQMQGRRFLATRA